MERALRSDKGKDNSDLGDAEFGIPGRVKPSPDTINALPRIPADA